ncbi:MoaD/ThiS family protein [Haloechinothrix sp. LS1_15]|uniref:MoaD/ThiS family protein n=1 Tax=Haloechinothrix sp. LS1_15 TaxID=2652248 RepID=UPI002948AC42|nr:MoaD/ThiS family protein [Haloechinothrix sp. LS1_15]MDV6014380.1 MoaD/ThiS family protein [Haloechinothrix sp. LS1_15]
MSSDPAGNPGTITVRVRFFASARAAAGTERETVELPSGSTVADAVERLRSHHSAELDRVLRVASFLVDGVAVRDGATPLGADVELDVLPPFAGG